MADIAELLAEQKALSEKRKELLTHFIPFREALFNQIATWIDDATAAGVEGVGLYSRPTDVEFHCNLFFYHLTLFASADGALLQSRPMTHLQRKQLPLTARVLIYLGLDDEVPPQYDIRVAKEGASYKFDFYTRNTAGEWQLTTNGVADLQSAKDVALFLIDFFVDGLTTWGDAPTLNAMRSNSMAARRKLGFAP